MIEYRNIHIEYDRVLLENASFSLKSGCVTLIHGPSGIGKTALLYRLGLVVRDCDVLFEGNKIEDTDLYRRTCFSFVMQNNELINYLSVEENLREYARMAGAKISTKRIKKLLETVSLNVPLKQSCSLLSLGERQRLCIACALARNTRVIIADEPTASLDKDNKIMVFELLRKIAAMGKYVVLTSHEDIAPEYADVIYRISDKELVCEMDHEERSTSSYNHAFKPLPLISHHIMYYSRKNRTLILMNAVFLFLTVILSALISSWYGNYLDNTGKQLFESTEKYLYVTDGRNPGYPDKDTYECVSAEGIPVYSLKIAGTEISIVPYDPKALKTDQVFTKYGSDEHGIWFSYAAGDQYQGQKSGEFDLTISSEEGGSVWHGTSNGILKQGVYAYLLDTKELFVYMHPDDIASLKHGKRKGSLIYYDDFEQLEQAAAEYRKQGYTVNDEGAKYENIIAVKKNEIELFDKVKLILLAVTVLLLAGVNLITFRKRIRELVMLRISGVPGSVAGSILFLENLPALLVTFITGIVLSLILYFLKVSCLKSFLICFGTVLVIELVLLSINILNLQYMNFEKILRD